MRFVVGLAAAVVAGAVATAALGTPAAKTLKFQLVGRGTPVPTALGSGPCPQGRSVMAIASTSGKRVGTAYLCVLAIRKIDVPNYGVRRIVQTVREKDALPSGTIVSRQTQRFLFARDQRHTTATFRGQVLRGTGRYAHSRGTVTGGGPAVEGVARWSVTIRLSSRLFGCLRRHRHPQGCSSASVRGSSLR